MIRTQYDPINFDKLQQDKEQSIKAVQADARRYMAIMAYVIKTHCGGKLTIPHDWQETVRNTEINEYADPTCGDHIMMVSTMRSKEQV